jgi:hypothetical protein
MLLHTSVPPTSKQSARADFAASIPIVIIAAAAMLRANGLGDTFMLRSSGATKRPSDGRTRSAHPNGTHQNNLLAVPRPDGRQRKQSSRSVSEKVLLP